MSSQHEYNGTPRLPPLEGTSTIVSDQLSAGNFVLSDEHFQVFQLWKLLSNDLFQVYQLCLNYH